MNIIKLLPSGYKRRALIFFADLLIVNLAFLTAFVIRFDWPLPAEQITLFKDFLPLVVMVRLFCFYFFGLYHWSFRYASIHEFSSLVKAMLVSALGLTAIIYGKGIGFSRSVLFIDFMLNIFIVGGFRFSFRFFGALRKRKISFANTKRVLIIGAGAAGEMVARELWKNLKQGYLPIGFIDDNPRKKNIRMHNLEVLGNRDDIFRVVRRKKVDEIIIAIPSAQGKEIRDIIAHCERIKVEFKIVPSVHEIISGRVSLKQIRDVRIEDLLGRKPVEINLDEVRGYLKGRKVLVTGAAGSIGSELCRQITGFDIEQLILFDHNENNLYYLTLELEAGQGFKPEVVTGSVKDRMKLDQVMSMYRPEVVFHAAAHKHVPLMEADPEEAVKNNIIGTKNVIEAADKYGVERFVTISTDKAVNPTSVMGVSKKISEWVAQDLSRKSKTKFMTVRFGNVLGSDGSVVNIFKKQIAAGGPVTVTHKETRRFFMTAQEAVQLIIQAGALGRGGEIFILDMGELVKIVNLAKDLIALSGFKVGEDIDIKFIGLRPGEKLYEEILTEQEGVAATRYKQIFIARPDIVSSERLRIDIKELSYLAQRGMKKEIISKLEEMLPNYNNNNKGITIDEHSFKDYS